MQPGAVQPSARRIIVVRNVGLPRYLERQEIVRRAGQGRMIVAPNDWWSEPLGAMAQRVLAVDLGQRLPGSDVLAGEGPLGADPDREVALDLQRFDADGVLMLKGFFSIEGKGRRRIVGRLDISVPPASGSAPDLVKAMSVALAQAADRVARELSR